jgi:hypothetical protein
MPVAKADVFHYTAWVYERQVGRFAALACVKWQLQDVVMVHRNKPLAGAIDLSSRGAKLRLFVVLAGVMLTLAVAERMFDPAFRHWLLARRPSGELERSPIDTRLPPAPRAGESDSFVAVRPSPQPTGWEDALSRVEDDTLFQRPAEREAWRLIEDRVRQIDPAELRRQSLGEIGFAQLFQQPDAYRGQAVTVRGRVMNAARAELQLGDGERGERFVLWLLPAGGPTLPIVVYTQSLPAGFPPIERLPGGQLTKLREDVTVTGILLKRGSYHATDGPRTAPVVLAYMPDWVPPLRADGNRSPTAFGPSWLWPTIGAALGLAAIFVAAAAWLTRDAKGQGRGAANERLAAVNLSGVSVGPSTAELLQQMEEQRRGSK